MKPLDRGARAKEAKKETPPSAWLRLPAPACPKQGEGENNEIDALQPGAFPLPRLFLDPHRAHHARARRARPPSQAQSGPQKHRRGKRFERGRRSARRLKKIKAPVGTTAPSPNAIPYPHPPARSTRHVRARQKAMIPAGITSRPQVCSTIRVPRLRRRRARQSRTRVSATANAIESYVALLSTN